MKMILILRKFLNWRDVSQTEKTPEESLKMLEDVYQIWISSAKKYNSIIPEPKKQKKKSKVA